MALIECPDCGMDVSDQAMACPHCARPIQNSTVVIERTSKSYKIHMLFGVLFAFVGYFVGVPLLGQSIGYLIVVAGVIMLVGAISLAWWDHG